MVYSNSLSHPNMFSVVSGKTMVDTAIESINRCISLLILTGVSELFGEPEFGSGIFEITFDYATDTYFDQLKMILVDSIKKYEPRVDCTQEDITISHDLDTNHIHITIGYRVVNTNDYNQTKISLGVD